MEREEKRGIGPQADKCGRGPDEDKDKDERGSRDDNVG